MRPEAMTEGDAPIGGGLWIALRFPGGRYHATPWDAHPNEGLVEWPPSPWRILRALVATWLGRAPELGEAVVGRLLDRLSEVAPRYHTPPGTLAHTRHFMPQGKAGKTAMVFDAFVRLGGEDPLFVHWPGVILGPEEGAALDILLERMGYLGRSESWAQGARVKEGPAPNVTPREDGALRLLAPLPASELGGWREGALEERGRRLLAVKVEDAASKGKDPAKVTLGKRDKMKMSEDLPGDVLSALEVETQALRKAGWSQPPGSRWLSYRGEEAEVSPPPTLTLRPGRALPTVAHFALASAALPRVTETMAVAERIHAALVKNHPAPVFTGCDAEGRPLTGPHRHARILLECQEGQRLTHAVVHAPMGFDGEAAAALRSLGRWKVWGHGGHDIHVFLLGLSHPERLGGLGDGLSPALAEARVWRSATPFVPVRFPKRTRAGVPKCDEGGILQLGSPEHDLRRLMALEGLPEPLSVTALEHCTLGGGRLSWLSFGIERRREKRGRGRRGANRGFGFEVVFPAPVRGPIALGYGAHFGLGAFRPVP